MSKLITRLVVICLALALLLGVLAGCDGDGPRSARLGTYVSQLCEAIGPFESDAQTSGKVLGRYGLKLESRKSRQAMAASLADVIADSRHVVTTMQAVGTPDVHNGRTLAARMVATFDQIAESDAAWRSELRAGIWEWPATSSAKRERVRMSIGALVRVGRQFEGLPVSRESQNAMANSPVCREVFGSVRAGGEESNQRASDAGSDTS
jgi:hypothetical protein